METQSDFVLRRDSYQNKLSNSCFQAKDEMYSCAITVLIQYHVRKILDDTSNVAGTVA